MRKPINYVCSTYPPFWANPLIACRRLTFRFITDSTALRGETGFPCLADWDRRYERRSLLADLNAALFASISASNLVNCQLIHPFHSRFNIRRRLLSAPQELKSCRTFRPPWMTKDATGKANPKAKHHNNNNNNDHHDNNRQ